MYEVKSLESILYNTRRGLELAKKIDINKNSEHRLSPEGPLDPPKTITQKLPTGTKHRILCDIVGV